MTAKLHLDYATRDYEGFRQLLLSVIDQQGTAWRERAAADLGVMVVELLAYELDRLAYAGDRVAEEGFLATARRRESVRRHAALGDYALDRGNATRGLQWFVLAPAQALVLAAGSVVATPEDRRDRSAVRVYAETVEAAALAGSRNAFRLSRSALAGAQVLRLAIGHDQDLRTLGFAAGMRLLVGELLAAGDPVDQARTAGDSGFQLAAGEEVRIAHVRARGLELERPLRGTWPGGDDGAWVLGNLVEVRRGVTSRWTQVGRGGAALGEVPHEQFLHRRFELVRALRAEVEDARAAWIARPEVAALWADAHREMAAFRRGVDSADLATWDVRAAKARGELGALLAPLARAGGLLQRMLERIGREVPDELAGAERSPIGPAPAFEIDPGVRVAIPDQRLAELPTEDPVLWADRGPATLEVATGSAGVWTRWTEQPDLLRSPPDAHHYVVEIDGNARTTLRFGDGTTGALLPVGCQVMARWVAGDEAGGDLRAGALVAGAPHAPLPDGIVGTSNPLPTTGGRAPEPLAGIAARVELGLALPAVPVTAEDYRVLLALLDPRQLRAHGLERIGGRIAESAVTAANGAVEIVLRPASGVPGDELVADVRAWIERNRLAGTTAAVRLARALAVDIGVVVEVHPDVSAAELRLRVQHDVAAAFGDAASPALGRARDRAEVYRVIEQVPGVVWSQVVVFDVAGHQPATAREAIAPAADQFVRCAGIDGRAGGQVTVWTARRYALGLTVRYDALDNRPELAALQRLISALLSGPGSLPVQRGWLTLDRARLTEALAGVLAGAGLELEVTRLIVDRRAVERIAFDDRQVPILDHVTVVDGGLRSQP